jgi:hypothetical protein
MGAKVEYPDRFVFVYTCDGAFGISVPELMTCVREKIPITFLIMVNGRAEKKIKLFGFVIDILVLILTIIQVMLKFLNQ